MHRLFCENCIIAQVRKMWYTHPKGVITEMGGKTSAKSKNDWILKSYDRINLTVPKGDKEKIKMHAESKGESVNGFINRAIENQMEQDNESK